MVELSTKEKKKWKSTKKNTTITVALTQHTTELIISKIVVDLIYSVLF